MHHLGHACGSGGLEQELRAVDIYGAQQLVVARKRHLGHVVEDQIDILHRSADRLAVADVAEDELDIAGPVVGIVEVEDTDLVPGGDQTAD